MSATVAREPRNPVDKNALSVVVGGYQIGYIAKDLAAQISPAIDKAKCHEFKVAGVVRGGGVKAPSLGVHLWLGRRLGPGPTIQIPDDVARSGGYWTPWPPRGFAQELKKTVEPGDDVPGVFTGGREHGGKWRRLDTGDHATIVKKAREFLGSERDPLERHFAFNLLEESLYKLRDLTPALSDEYRETCESHHMEMTEIRPALLALLGGLPFIPMYKQMAIFHSKRQEFELAVRWCKRGLDVYGDNCLERQWPEDITKRMAKTSKRVGR